MVNDMKIKRKNDDLMKRQKFGAIHPKEETEKYMFSTILYYLETKA